MDQEEFKSKVQRLCTTTNDLHKTVLECREDLIQFNCKFQVAQRYMHFGIRGTYTMLKHSMNTMFERLEKNYNSLIQVNEMFPDTGIVLCDVGNKMDTVIDLTMDLVDQVDQPEKDENKKVNDVVDEKKSPEKIAFEFDTLEEKDFLAVGDTLSVVSDVLVSPEVPMSKKRKADDEEQEK